MIAFNRITELEELDAVSTIDFLAPSSAKRPRSAAQIAASKRNGTRSRGPKTAAGKAVSRANAITHGLLAYKLRPIADYRQEDGDFDHILDGLRAEFRPHTTSEILLVENLANDHIRLCRIKRFQECVMVAPASASQGCLDFDHPADRDLVTSLLESVVDCLKNKTTRPYTRNETQRLVELIQKRALVLLGNAENTKACSKAGEDVSNHAVDEFAFTDRIRPTLVKAVISEAVAAMLSGGMILSDDDREHWALLVSSALDLYRIGHAFNRSNIETFNKSERRNTWPGEALKKLESLLAYENTVLRMIDQKMDMLARLRHDRRKCRSE